jgi:hypothetical protein
MFAYFGKQASLVPVFKVTHERTLWVDLGSLIDFDPLEDCDESHTKLRDIQS